MKRRDFIAACGSASLSLPYWRQAAASPCPPSRLSVLDGSATTNNCGLPVAMPSYMQGMSDFAVRNLTNVTGHVTMVDALPAEWRVAGFPTAPENVFNAWNGGAGDAKGRRLYVHGGGHSDSGNNGLHVYDFAGDSAPVGWKVATNSLSALSAIVSDSNTYSDGKPTAVHTYGGLWFDPIRNRFYRFGGSAFGSGSGTGACFYYDVGSASWVAFVNSNNVGGTLNSSLIGSPDGAKLLFLSSSKSPIFVDASTRAITPYGDAVTGSAESGPSTVLDSNRSSGGSGICRYVMFYRSQNGAAVKIITVDWAKNTWTSVSQSLSGALAGELVAAGTCVVFDAQRDVFWVFAPAASGSGLVSYIYEVSAANFSVTRHTLPSSIVTATNFNGGFNRCIWFPDWRIIGTVHAYNQPMSLIKLP